MFRAFVVKEFQHILRDVRTLLVLIGLPIALIVLFGFAISTEIRSINLGVQGNLDDAQVRRIVEKVGQSEYFQVRDYFLSPTEVEDALRSGKVQTVLSFGDDFSRKMASGQGAELSIIADATNPNDASTLVMYLGGILESFGVEQTLSSGLSLPKGVEVNTRMLYNPQLRSAYNFVPGILGLVLLIICALMTSVSIVKEKETGTMEVLMVSPVKPIAIVFAKMIPYFVLSCVILTIVFLMIFFVLKVPIVGSLFWVIAVSLLYVVLSLAIGLLVSTIARTQIVAALVTGMVFMVPVMMLSGMIYDLNSVPAFFRVVSNIIPARWFIAAIKKIMIEGLPVVYAAREIIILVGMTVALFVVAIKKFNDRLE